MSNQNDERAEKIVAQLRELELTYQALMDEMSAALKKAREGVPLPEGMGKQRRALKDQREALLEELKEIDAERYAEEWDRLYGWVEDLPELPGEEETTVIFRREDPEATGE